MFISELFVALKQKKFLEKEQKKKCKEEIDWQFSNKIIIKLYLSSLDKEESSSRLSFKLSKIERT